MRLEQYLNEKWLMAYKHWGHINDVFVNPGPSDQRELGKKSRFIADAKEKKVYAWSVMGDMHGDAWTKIRKEINEPRHLYKGNKGTLVTGIWEGHYANFHAIQNMNVEDRKAMKNYDWSFLYKYYDCEDDFKVYLGK